MSILNNQQRVVLLIDGYIRKHRVEIPQDIVIELQKKFVVYHWTSNIFYITSEQFKFILLSCASNIVENSKKKSKTIIDAKRVLELFKIRQINGAGFCRQGRAKFCRLMQENNICSMGISIKLWQQVYEFNFEIIPVGTPIFINMQE